jgi:hypothetical protein
LSIETVLVLSICPIFEWPCLSLGLFSRRYSEGKDDNRNIVNGTPAPPGQDPDDNAQAEVAEDYEKAISVLLNQAIQVLQHRQKKLILGWMLHWVPSI